MALLSCLTSPSVEAIAVSKALFPAFLSVLEEAPARWAKNNVFSGVLPYTSSTLILFCVNVPVLSLQRISIDPKSSMADNLLTITCLFASLRAPIESEKVVTTGNASGITLTASATAKRSNVPVSLVPLINKLTATTSVRVARTTYRVNLLKL